MQIRRAVAGTALGAVMTMGLLTVPSQAAELSVSSAAVRATARDEGLQASQTRATPAVAPRFVRQGVYRESVCYSLRDSYAGAAYCSFVKTGWYALYVEV